MTVSKRPERRPGRRIVNAILLGALAVGLVASALLVAPVQAQERGDTATVEIHFWAYSRNPEFYSYHTTNHLGDQIFFVGQAGAAEPAFSQIVMEGEDPQDIVTSREVRDAYHWAADGIEGNPTSPSGFSAVTLAEAGPNLSVTCDQVGRPPTPVGSIPRIADDTGLNYAEYEIRDIYWSPDEAVAVVILKQTMGGAWPLEVETAHGFTIEERPEAPPAP